MNPQTLRDAQIIWDYMALHEPTASADLLLVLGGVDERVAVWAAELSRQHTYERVMFTGGVAHVGDLLQTSWSETEAEYFYDVFQKSGGTAGQALLETSAQNTGQNATLSYELLRRSEAGVPRSMEIVTKPYMERRARATFEVQWPDMRMSFFVTSPRISFADYPNDAQPFDTLVAIMVGDFERIMEYPKRGLQAPQPVPEKAKEAWRRLVEAGYTEHLIR